MTDIATVVEDLTPAALTPREELVRDLHALADWLAANPHAPVGESASVRLQHSIHDGSDAAKAADVRRLASQLGTTVNRDDADGVSFTIQVAPRAEFIVHATTRGGVDRWQAAMKVHAAMSRDGAP